MEIWIEAVTHTLLAVGLLLFCGWGLTLWLIPPTWKKYQYLVMPFAGLFLIDSLSHFTSSLGWGGDQSSWLLLALSLSINLLALFRLSSVKVPSPREGWVALLALPILVLSLLPALSIGEMLPIGDTNADPISHTATTDFLQFHGIPDSVPVDSEHPVYVPVYGKVKGRVRLGFHFYQMYVNIITKREAYSTFPIVTAVGLYLWAVSVWFMARVTWRMPLYSAYIAELLFALSALPLWVGYGGYGPQVLGMGILVLSFGAWVEALSSYTWQPFMLAAILSAALAGIYAEALPYVVAPVGALFLIRLWEKRGETAARLFKGVMATVVVTLLLNPIGWWRAIARVVLVATKPNLGNVDTFLSLFQVFGLRPLANHPLPDVGVLPPQMEIFWETLLLVGFFIFIVYGLLRYKGASFASLVVGVVLYLLSLGWFALQNFPYGYFKGWSMALYLFIILFAYGVTRVLSNPRASKLAYVLASVVLVGAVLSNAYSSVFLALSQRQHFACTPEIAQMQQGVRQLPRDASLYVSTGKISPVSEFWIAYFLKDYSLHFDSPVIYTPYSAHAYAGERWVIQHKSSEYSFPEEIYGLDRYWSGDAFTLWEVYTERVMSEPDMEYRASAVFDDRIELLGFDTSCDEMVRPGDIVDLTLYWQPIVPIEKSYKVFVHVINASSGVIQAQKDGYPVRWNYPTDAWRQGEVVIDPYAIQLPSDTMDGRYTLQVGLYLETSGERLPVMSQSEQVTQDAFVICNSFEVKSQE